MLPAVQRQVLFVHFPNGFPVNGDLAAVRRFNAADDVQQRGFSGTGRPQQYADFAFFNADVNAPEHIDTAFTLSDKIPNYIIDSRAAFVKFILANRRALWYKRVCYFALIGKMTEYRRSREGCRRLRAPRGNGFVWFARERRPIPGGLRPLQRRRAEFL